jgi:hypothetical protein
VFTNLNPGLQRKIAGILASRSSAARAPDRTALLFAFRLRSGKEPVRTAGLRCLDPASLRPLPAVPSYASNADGEGVVFWRQRFGSPPPSVVLEIRLREQEDWTRTAEIPVQTSMRLRVPLRDLTLEVSSDPLWDRSPEPVGKKRAKRKRRRPVAIALAGSQDQLREVGRYLEGFECVRLRKIFVEGRKPRDLKLGRDVAALPLADIGPEALEDVDALFDFSDRRELVRLGAALGKDPGRRPLLFFCGRRVLTREGRPGRAARRWLESIARPGGDDGLE